MLHASELRWALEPIPRLETLDLLTFDESELFAYTRGLQIECASIRELMREAMDQIAGYSQQLAKANAALFELRYQLADLRLQLAAARQR